MELPTLSQEQIKAALMGTKYGDLHTKCEPHDWDCMTVGYFNACDDALENAARAILLQRELDSLNEWLLRIAEQYGGFERGTSLTPEHGRVVINAALNRIVSLSTATEAGRPTHWSG